MKRCLSGETSLFLVNESENHYQLAVTQWSPSGNTRNDMKKYVVGLGLLSILSIFVGAGQLDLTGLLAGEPHQQLLLVETRLPRTISLILAGGMLAICGLVIQKVLQNPFVSTNSIGMVDASRLGILLVMLFLPDGALWLRSLVAFLCSYLGVLVFLALTRILPKRNPLILPLAGMMFGNIVGAIASFFGYQFQLVQNMSSWLQGNFATVMKADHQLIYLTVPVFLLLFVLLHRIMVLSLGDDLAQNFGLDVNRMQFLVLALVALGSTAVLIMVGSVPFLGIVVPNLINLRYGDHLKHSFLLTGVAGSCLLLSCDILARVIIPPYEVPVSVVMGIVGGLLFLMLLLRRSVA